jgi:hypothetical protein
MTLFEGPIKAGEAMQKTRKSIGAAIISIMATITVTAPAGSGAVAASQPAAVALDPCPLPLPMEAAHDAPALWADGRQPDAVHARSGLVLPARVPLPPAADTGFGCPIARTTS